MEQLLLPYLIFQYLLLSIFMLASKTPQNRLLFGVFILTSIRYLSFRLMSTNEWLPYEFNFSMVLFLFSTSFCVIFVFLYFMSIVGKNLKRIYVVFLFIIAMSFCGFSAIGMLFTNSLDQYISSNYFCFGFDLFYFLMLFFCYIKALVEIRKVLAGDTSLIKSHHLLVIFWGRFYLRILLIIAIVQFTMLFFYAFKFVDQDGVLDVFLTSIDQFVLLPTVTLLAMAIAYFALRNPAAFYIDQTEERGVTFERYAAEVMLPRSMKSTYSSKLNEESEKYKEILIRIENFFLLEKGHLNSKLTLKLLSDKLNTSSHELSFVINRNWKKNFNELINFYRILTATELLARESNITMYAVSMDSGFNSESTFYSVFKKETGKTPKEYRAYILLEK